MSLRYTNTDKWNDAWFSNLKPLEKLVFVYLCDNCDIAGFIEVNIKRWTTDIGTDRRGIEGALKGLQRGIVISETGDCYFIKNFLKHQKNLPVNPSNPSHKGIINRFNNYSIKFNYSDFNEFIEETTKGHRSPFEGASKGLQSPICNGNGNGNGKEEKGGLGEKTKKIPTIEETVDYFNENGFSKEAAEKFWKYYDSGKWKDSKGKPVLSWKQKAQSIWFKPENRKDHKKGSLNEVLTREQIFGNG
jgi:hypothetical protein